MVNWCFTLGVILLAIGIIESVFIFSKGSFFLFVIGIASAIVNSIVYFAVAELNERLEKLEREKSQEKSINKKNAYVQTHMYEMLSDKIILDNGGWKCEKCKRVNSSYVGTCACGRSKYE